MALAVEPSESKAQQEVKLTATVTGASGETPAGNVTIAGAGTTTIRATSEKDGTTPVYAT